MTPGNKRKYAQLLISRNATTQPLSWGEVGRSNITVSCKALCKSTEMTGEMSAKAIRKASIIRKLLKVKVTEFHRFFPVLRSRHKVLLSLHSFQSLEYKQSICGCLIALLVGACLESTKLTI